MTWTEGRQGTGYKKALIAQGSSWDCYLIKYPEGSSVPPHTDPAPGKRHYRLNVLLRGQDNYRGAAILKLWRVCFFRPDITVHEVAPVKAPRLVLSFGWVRP